MEEYAIQVAQTAKEQLITMTPASVLMSWGIKEFTAMV